MRGGIGPRSPMSGQAPYDLPILPAARRIARVVTLGLSDMGSARSGLATRLKTGNISFQTEMVQTGQRTGSVMLERLDPSRNQ